MLAVPGNKMAGSRKGIPNKWTKEFKTNVENCFNGISARAAHSH